MVNKVNGKEGKIELSSKGVPINWNGENWEYYKALMVSYFEEKDLENIASGEKILDDGADERVRLEWKQKQAQIKRLILGSVSLTLAQRVMKKSLGTEMWMSLLEYYEAPNNQILAVHKQRQLLHKLWHTRASKGDNMVLHIGKMMNIRDQLTLLKYPVHDVDMVDALLNSLPPNEKYQQLAQMVRLGIGGQSKPEEIRDLILVAEAQLKEEADDVFGARRSVGINGKSSNNKEQQSGSVKTWQNKKHRSNLECFICHQMGHIKRFCPELELKLATIAGAHVKPEIPQQKQKSQYQQKAGSGGAKKRSVSCAVVPMLTSPVVSEVDVLLDIQELQDGYDPGLWHYNTASSAHIVGTMNYFVAYEEFDMVKDPCRGFAQNMLTHAVGMGEVELVTKSEKGQLHKFTLDRVLYVPSARWNLFSAGVARDQGLTELQESETGAYNVYDRNKFLLTATLQSNHVWSFRSYNSFVKNSFHNDSYAQAAEVVSFTKTDGLANIRVWHTRLGHTNAQYLKSMADKNLVDGMMLKGRELPMCEMCQLSKQKSKKHLKSLNRDIREPNDVLFVDLMDPGKHNSTRFTHVLVVVDGFSRLIRLYPLKVKTETNEILQQYITWAERQIGRCVKCVISDGGTAFGNSAMKAWYKSHGIDFVVLAPGASSVNLAERAIQSLRNMMKSMLVASGLPQSFWPDALQNTVYIKNRVLCRSIESRTPFELFFGKRPDIHHIRTFGALAYAHIPRALRKKMTNNCEVGYSLGYAEDRVGTKVYFPEYHIARVVFDVRVNESILYGDREDISPSIISHWT